MGLLDNLKDKIGPAKEKVSELAHQSGDKVERGLDKAAKLVDEKTKGKYHDKIHTGTDKAKGAMERLTHRDTGPATGRQTPPDAPQPPASGPPS
ncbi:antitoxin [Streptomyces yaanensis]|uniref:Antitoxin n=1 Tax=Streptomyces yaanensis TaxID=1142239 RepID=A0ABV7SFP0_9ACTN|nr:antitoxin [Streptomyces sp. CGMCC 4.7035]WNB98207.1 antitoxin [Streptomyces sp. CGMCC 4.7035]